MEHTVNKPSAYPVFYTAPAHMQDATPAQLDELVRTHTACTGMADLLATHPSYCPSIRADMAPELLAVADAFDAACRLAGQNRRAYRYWRDPFTGEVTATFPSDMPGVQHRFQYSQKAYPTPTFG